MTPFRSLQSILLLLFLGIDADCAYPPRIPLEVEYAGCQAVLLPGPACVLGPERALSLWIGAPPEAQIEIRAGGERIDAVSDPVREGQQFSLTIPSGLEKVDVLVEAPDGRAAWFLDLRAQGQQPLPAVSRDVLQEIDQTTSRLYRSIQDYRFTEVRETLDRLPLPAKAPAESRYLVSYYHGLLAQKKGDYRSALAEIGKAIEIAERVSLKREQRIAEEKLGLLLLGLGRPREAAEILDQLARTGDANDEARLLNNQGWSALLAREAGESFADPTPLFERVLRIYETSESVKPHQRFNVLINLALAHLQAGRLPEANARLSQAHELGQSATLLQKLWWLDLEARVALQEGRPEEALHQFERLDELALATSSSDGRLRAAFGRARSHEALGDAASALEDLEKAETLLDEQSLQIPVHEGRETFMATRQGIVSLHVDLLLRQGRKEEALALARNARSRMLRQLERSDRLASLAPDQRIRWESLLKEYHAKRQTLEERAKDDWTLPPDQLRREQAARKVETEALRKLLDQAFLILGDPQERPGWAPAPPQPGELILIYRPLPHGWVGFAADARSTAAHRFDLPPDITSRSPAEQARLLLLPFRDSIARARRIRILSSGPLQNVDFHALPFDGDILLARLPVVYGVDLPAPSSAPELSRKHRALLVADPRENLLGAHKEAEGVREALESWDRPWAIAELKTTQASPEAVQNRLAAADLLHYAGHGEFSGFGGWESSLLLAEETRLTLGDLLALERVPSWVVLSGCYTGQSSADTPVESLGLAHAFLLAGSQAVVASTRKAEDSALPAFFSELYREWGRENEGDLAVALQRAQLSWRQRDPGADWAGFRLFAP